MAGSCPKIIKDAKSNGFKKRDWLCLILPFIIVIAICFIPGLGNVNLGEDMLWYNYLLLLPVGIVASCALVVPGISGSMLLVILGYYTPILGLVSALKTSPLHSLLVLVIFAVGVVIGFFTIAKLMQFLLTRFTRATYWAIVGFVLGSLPAILIVFDYANSPINALQISLGILLCILGAIGTYFLTRLSEKKKAEKKLEK
jgi:putative membrane protein